ncbi:MAG: peptide-methionine (S)-S-oxide reductase MsrA [Pseudomonadota bacterium]
MNITIRLLSLFFVLLMAGCQTEVDSNIQSAPTKVPATTNASLVVAGGCFWCVESDFEKLPGVGDVISGYAGGASQSPTYQSHADHLEVVQIPYDKNQSTYRQLVDYLLRHIDPLDAGGQFCDRGHSYTTAVFYSTPAEKLAAEEAVAQAQELLGAPVATKVIALDKFWRAEEYHQDYYKKNPIRYKYYRNGCGRDQRVAQVWGNAS